MPGFNSMSRLSAIRKPGRAMSLLAAGRNYKVLGFRWPRAPPPPGRRIGEREYPLWKNVILVVVLEILGNHLPMHIHDVYAGIRDAVSQSPRLGRFVQDVIGADDLRIRIREQRIGDMLPAREVLERADRIVADRQNAESLLSDRFQMLLQLHELDFAERSPVRRTEKDQHGSLRAHDRLESPASGRSGPSRKTREPAGRPQALS